MNTCLSLSFRLARLNFPLAVLLGVMQRTPVVRVFTAAVDRFSNAPLGAMLRAATVGLGAMGTVHALAGATTLVTSKPSPLNVTVGVPIAGIGFGINGPGVGQPGSWVVGGSIPPGLNFSGLTAPGSLNISNLALTGTPTAGGTYLVTLQGWENANRKGNGSPIYPYTIVVAGAAAAVAPVFTAQPGGQTVDVGGGAVFSAAATGTPSPGFQWLKDGAAIAGATNASYTLAAVRSVDAGAYAVVATNSAGSVTSSPAQLAVTATAPPAVAPVFTTPPSAQTIVVGGSVTFTAVATGAPAPVFQWTKDGAAVAGATNTSYTLTAAAIADTGSYAVVATNSAGSVTSAAARLTVNSLPVGPTTESGRLVNLSILTNAGAGAKVLTMGAYIGGTDLPGAMPLVIRAVGPTLGTAFGIGGVLADPVMTVNAQGVATPIAVNDNWGGTAVCRSAFAAVGAFALPDTSLDCAYVPPTPGLATGGYTVQVVGAGNSSGLVIAEIYDATVSPRPISAPRLMNLSTLAQIDPGATLAVGFVIGGTAPCRVLVRAVGPTLGTAFGLGGVMADPGLVLFNNDLGQQIGTNDDWGGGASLSNAMSAVGAFALADPASRDAVLVVTLATGAYSARVAGKNGAGGTALVEVYEAP